MRCAKREGFGTGKEEKQMTPREGFATGREEKKMTREGFEQEKSGGDDPGGIRTPNLVISAQAYVDCLESHALPLRHQAKVPS